MRRRTNRSTQNIHKTHRPPKRIISRERRQPWSFLPYFLIIAGVILTSLSWLHRVSYNRSLRLSDSLIASYTAQPATEAVPVSVSIPGIPRLLVVEAGKINGTWSVSDKAANHVRGSANPGMPGNIIIYAHNTAPLFGRLNLVKADDIITVTTADADRHTYRVIEIRTVTTDKTDLLRATSQEILTLYTCTGWLDSKRLVVRAVPADR